jgi:uncharacterized protein (TIGR02246 family)
MARLAAQLLVRRQKSEVGMMAPHRWLGSPLLVLLAALVAGCNSGEEGAERSAGRPTGVATSPRPPEAGAMRQAGPATKPPTEPQDWPPTFVERVNAGDLDGAAAMYEPDARFVTPSGETLVGREQVRRALAGLIGAKARMTCRVVKTVAAGDVAVLYTDFQLTTVEASGKAVEVNQNAIEVLRRQPDGTWRLIVGDPNGRKR